MMEEIRNMPENVVLDSKNAFEQIRIAAENGDADAQFRLAECYKNGFGCKKSIDKCLVYMKKAEANGNEDARRELLTYYHDVVKEKSKYVDILKSGRKQGDQKSTVLLADLYANGKEGVITDLQYAYEIISKLKENGAVFEDATEFEIAERIEARYETITTRKNLILLFKIFMYAFGASLLLNYLGLLGIVVMAVFIGPAIKWLIPWYDGYVQRADSLDTAKIIAWVAGIISVPYTLLTLLGLRIIAALFLGV